MAKDTPQPYAGQIFGVDEPIPMPLGDGNKGLGLSVEYETKTVESFDGPPHKVVTGKKIVPIFKGVTGMTPAQALAVAPEYLEAHAGQGMDNYTTALIIGLYAGLVAGNDAVDSLHGEIAALVEKRALKQQELESITADVNEKIALSAQIDKLTSDDKDKWIDSVTKGRPYKGKWHFEGKLFSDYSKARLVALLEWMAQQNLGFFKTYDLKTDTAKAELKNPDY